MISYIIDFIVIVCCITKYVCSDVGARYYYENRILLTGLVDAYFVCAWIEQVFQFMMFALTMYILYKIRTILNKRPVCQTGLCEETPKEEDSTSTKSKSDDDDHGIIAADKSSLLDSRG